MNPYNSLSVSTLQSDGFKIYYPTCQSFQQDFCKTVAVDVRTGVFVAEFGWPSNFDVTTEGNFSYMLGLDSNYGELIAMPIGPGNPDNSEVQPRLLSLSSTFSESFPVTRTLALTESGSSSLSFDLSNTRFSYSDSWTQSGSARSSTLFPTATTTSSATSSPSKSPSANCANVEDEHGCIELHCGWCASAGYCVDSNETGCAATCMNFTPSAGPLADAAHCPLHCNVCRGVSPSLNSYCAESCDCYRLSTAAVHGAEAECSSNVATRSLGACVWCATYQGCADATNGATACSCSGIADSATCAIAFNGRCTFEAERGCTDGPCFSFILRGYTPQPYALFVVALLKNMLALGIVNAVGPVVARSIGILRYRFGAKHHLKVTELVLDRGHFVDDELETVVNGISATDQSRRFESSKQLLEDSLDEELEPERGHLTHRCDPIKYCRDVLIPKYFLIASDEKQEYIQCAAERLLGKLLSHNLWVRDTGVSLNSAEVERYALSDMDEMIKQHATDIIVVFTSATVTGRISQVPNTYFDKTVLLLMIAGELLSLSIYLSSVITANKAAPAWGVLSAWELLELLLFRVVNSSAPSTLSLVLVKYVVVLRLARLDAESAAQLPPVAAVTRAVVKHTRPLHVLTVFYLLVQLPVLSCGLVGAVLYPYVPAAAVAVALLGGILTRRITSRLPDGSAVRAVLSFLLLQQLPVLVIAVSLQSSANYFLLFMNREKYGIGYWSVIAKEYDSRSIACFSSNVGNDFGSFEHNLAASWQWLTALLPGS